MHTLWKHKNGKFYVLYGPRLRSRASLRTKDRKEAEILLAQFIAESSNQAPDAPLVGTILDGYVASRTKDGRRGGGKLRAPNALKFAVQALKPKFAPLRPDHICQNTVAGYAADRKKSGIGNGTILREVGVLRAAFSWAAAHKWITKAQVPVIENPVPSPKGRERWLSREEYSELRDSCQMAHLRLFVVLGVMTGARSGAILELKWSQVDFKRRLIDFGMGWGNKRRAIVPINADLMRALQAAQEISCTDYVVEYAGGPIGTVKNGFEAACVRAKLEGVTPHVLRHTCATWQVEAGVSYEEIGKMLGDTAETIERIYGHHSPKFLKKGTKALESAPVRRFLEAAE